MRNLLILCLLAGALTANAQVSISASSVTDAAQRPQTARLCFTPVNAAQSAVGFRVGSNQVIPNEVCGTVSAGVLQSGFVLAATPSGIYYHIYAKPMAANTIIRDYGMSPITGSSWSLDTYDPATMSVPAVAVAAGTATALAPGASPTLSITPGSPALLNVGIPQGLKGDPGAVGGVLSGWTQTGSGLSRVDAAPGAVVAGTSVSAPEVTVSGSPSASTDAITVSYGSTHYAASNASTTVNGVPCTLGASCAIIGSVLNPRGAYATATAYATGDLVSNASNVWACITGCTSVTPVAGAHWLLVGPQTGLTPAQLAAIRTRMPLPVNLFNSATVTAGYYVNTSTGALTSASTYTASDYIPANSGGSMTLSGSSSSSNNTIAYYDASQVYISGSVQAGVTAALTVPSNAAFLRVGVLNGVIPTLMIVNGTVAPTTYQIFGTPSPAQVYASIQPQVYASIQSITSRLPALSNLFNLATITAGYYVSNITGALVSSGPDSTTDYIPAEAGGSMTYSGALSGGGGNNNMVAYYDGSQTFISGAIFTTASGTLTVPSNAAFVRMAFPSTVVSTFMLVNGSSSPAFYLPYAGIAPWQVSNLLGKRLGVLGDSISSVYTPTWQTVVLPRLGMTQTFQDARPGRAFANSFECYGAATPGTTPGNYDPTIVTFGGYTCGYSAWSPIGSVTGHTLAQNIANVDVMVVALGTNDFAVTIGAPGDATNAGTLYGNMRWVIEALLTANPAVHIVMVTNQYGSSGSIGTQAQQQAVSSAEVAFAKSYGIPVLNMYETGGVNSFTAPTLERDGIHPSVFGYANFYGPRIAQFLQGLF